jgi:hypothetical protein
MQLDIRLPCGLLFLILGLLLVGYGACSTPADAQRFFGLNVNITWGIIFALFGGVMLWLSRRSIKNDKP